MIAMLQDVKYSLRMLANRPGLTFGGSNYVEQSRGRVRS